jgi:antitoxin (DNA-binding transcriptional repressor) of toxin-antitoxin stability system
MAVGGTRQVPVPDAVARDYLLLALRLDQHLPGTVDGFYGPAALKAQVDMEQLRSAGRLAEDAVALRARLNAEVADDAPRRHWLDLQLVALETLARVRAGEEIPYLEQVERCFAITPTRRPDAEIEAAAASLDALLPGDGSLAERRAAEDGRWTVPPDRVRAVVDALVPRFRSWAARHFDIPPGDGLAVNLVHDQPWSGYNWYDGGSRSRVDFNLDLPVRLPQFVGVVAHETYPGHHLEHALKEAVLVEARGHGEAAALLINTPECLISEGLANLGRELVVPPAALADLLVELAPVAGLPLAGDATALRDGAERQAAIRESREILDQARLNAALLLHADARPRDEVIDYLVTVGRFDAPTAAKRLEFIEHPLWRLYIYVYFEGERQLRDWLHLVPAADRPARFGRLLAEPHTPVSIQAEIDAG